MPRFHKNLTNKGYDLSTITGHQEIVNATTISMVAPEATLLSAIIVSSTRIDLYWLAAHGATSYRLERSVNGINWVSIYTGSRPRQAMIEEKQWSKRKSGR